MARTNRLFVISLGGSLIFPNNAPDTKFLSAFRRLVLEYVRKGHRFILITGGGKISRLYQESLKTLHQSSLDNLDWIGIYGTRLNAQLLRLAFPVPLVHSRIVEDPNLKTNFREKILIAGGWKPGRSTDDDAVRLAKNYGAATIINLSNIDFVYTKDPRKYSDARPIASASWDEFSKIIGKKWKPGANLPFDPIAARTAKRHHLGVIITQGKNLKNLRRILEGKNFIGTYIK